MEMPWLPALSGMVGTIVGASATVVIAWLTQRSHHRRELARERLQKNEAVYGEFIDQCARLMVDAVQHQLEKPDTMLPVYALINRIRLCASDQVLAAAEFLLGRLTDQYYAPNLSVDQVRELAHSLDADPLRTFGEAARGELGLMRRQL